MQTIYQFPGQILKMSFEDILKEIIYSQRKLVNTFFIKQELYPIPVQIKAITSTRMNGIEPVQACEGN